MDNTLGQYNPMVHLLETFIDDVPGEHRHVFSAPVDDAQDLDWFRDVDDDYHSEGKDSGMFGASDQEGERIIDMYLSESSGAEDDSDVDDVFEIKVRAAEHLPHAYKEFFLYRWQCAVESLCGELRDEVLLPLEPRSGNTSEVWTAVDQALVLPSWHCAFRGCPHTSTNWNSSSTSEAGLWDHVWSVHKASFWEKISKRSGFNLQEESHLRLEEIAFTLYNAALAEKERQCCPLLGVATDRRALLHLGEVFTEDNVSTLMCFICGCKHIRTTATPNSANPFAKATLIFV